MVALLLVVRCVGGVRRCACGWRRKSSPPSSPRDIVGMGDFEIPLSDRARHLRYPCSLEAKRLRDMQLEPRHNVTLCRIHATSFTTMRFGQPPLPPVNFAYAMNGGLPRASSSCVATPSSVNDVAASPTMFHYRTAPQEGLLFDRFRITFTSVF